MNEYSQGIEPLDDLEDKKPKIESSYEDSVKEKDVVKAILDGQKPRRKHNYTSELELKSLLIRIKNKRTDKGTVTNNKKINKYIKWHTAVNNKKYDYPSKRNKLKAKLKDRIISLSETTSVDRDSYERFGEIILLMVKNILKKPSFSGYTYRDDFYSDAVYKILKYLHNFDHTMISERTGLAVNAFAYISQIIHNSILFIINSKKKEWENLKKQISMEHLNHNMQLKADTYLPLNLYNEEREALEDKIVETIHIKAIKTTLVDEIKALSDEIDRVTAMNLYYPKDYAISFEEYEQLKPLMKGKLSVMRAKD
jgi:hypothetical protein